MVRRTVIMLALLPALAGAVTATNWQAAWHAYLLDVRDRGLAVSGCLPGVIVPLAATSTLRVAVATNAYSTNCWTLGSNVICVTNYALTTSPLVATNMVAGTPSNLLADYVWLQASYTQSFTSADLVRQADAALFSLIDSGLFVDTNVIGAAGGLAGYFDSYTATNWYWVDTDFDDASGEPGDTWWAFPQHPTNLPVLTMSNAWRYAGLEPLLTNVTVWTNADPQIVYGWQAGDLNSYSTTNTTPRVMTNVSYAYVFPRAPSSTTFRAEIEQARIEAISEHYETNVVAGVTNVVTVWTTALVHAASPAAVPQAYIPPRLWSNAGARAYFTMPVSTGQPAPALQVNLEGAVARWPLDLSQEGTDVVSWSTATAGVQLAQAFYQISAITSAWRGLERSDSTNPSLRGATVSIVYTNVIATLGGWDGFRSPLTPQAWSQRVTVLSYLRLSRIVPENSSQAEWEWTPVIGNENSHDAAYTYSVHRSPWATTNCDPWVIVSSNESGVLDMDEACGPDGLVDPAFTSSATERAKVLPGIWWSLAAGRECYDLVTYDSIRYTAGQPFWSPCQRDDRTLSESVSRQWLTESGDLEWRTGVQLHLTNLWPGTSCDVFLVSTFFRPWQAFQFRDRIGGYTLSEGLQNNACWPYDDQRWGDVLYGDGFVPELPWPASYFYTWTDYQTDSTNDLVLEWQLQVTTNSATIASDLLPAATNRLAVTWMASKASGASNLTSGSITNWPTTDPPLPYIEEYSISRTFTDSYSTNYGGGSYEGREGTRTRTEHYWREATPPNSEGLGRQVADLQVMFDWHFMDRVEGFQ